MGSIYDACEEKGGHTAWSFDQDPKRICFQMSRYKFVAKMLEGKQKVLEVGCADGQGSKIVRQHVGELIAVDSDPVAIERAKALASTRWTIQFRLGDIMNVHVASEEEWHSYDAVYSLDVFEHIADDTRLLGKLSICAPVCIIGTPSKESQTYASAISKAGHVNCVTKEELRAKCLRRWTHVFMFGMNDEVVHTGFGPMSNYLFALCVR